MPINLNNPFDIEASVLYKDALLIIIDKPAGIAVHKGRGPYPCLDPYLHQLQYGLPTIPALAHRLDRETSGCLILGRNRHGLRTMSNLFATSQVEKTYLAFVHGTPFPLQGEISEPLLHLTEHSYHWRMKCDPLGKESRTSYETLKILNGYSLVQLKPHTGRTHQLRVHCAFLGCPIVGDTIYGNQELDGMFEGLSGLHLHASALKIPLYYMQPDIQVQAPLPAHMLNLLHKTA